MNKHIMRMFCLLLVLSMVFCLVACGGNEESSQPTEASETSTEVSVDPEQEYKDANGNYKTKLGVLDEYKGKTFSILVVGEKSGTYQSDDFSTEAGSGGIDYGDTYYNEVLARNEKVEETYEIELDLHKLDDTFNEARNDAMTGTHLYDAMILNVGGAASLAQEGLLINLFDLENIDTLAPWWDQRANAAYSVANKLYFTTGDITIMNKVNTWSILFNKDMVKNNNLESPYDLYEDGTWTFDKMCEMAATVNTATSPEQIEDPSVTYGLLSAYGDIYRIYGGSGETLCQKDSKDEPVIRFGVDESSINNTIKILEKLNNNAWNVYAEKTADPWGKTFAAFYDGRVLFRPSGFSATTKLRALANIEFGIVPMPKINNDQEDYWTVTDGSFAACISKNCADPEFSAYMLDAFAAEAKNFITPAYVEANLKWKALRDDESAEILDYIFNHINYDVAAVYNFGKITNLFSNLAKASSTDVVSSFDAIKTEVESAIEDVIINYQSDT